MNENMPPFKKLLHINKKRSLILGSIILIIALSTYLGVTYYFKSTNGTNTSYLATPPEIVPGKIITLKQLKEDYFIDYHNMYSNIVRAGLEFPKEINLAWTVRYLKGEMSRDQAHAKRMVMFCIFDNKENKLIGALEVRDKNDYDPGQIGTWINENYWGGGRYLEAVALITNIYFRTRPHEKNIIAHVRLWNKRSYHALKKAGFKDLGYYDEHGEPSRHILELTREQVLGPGK